MSMDAQMAQVSDMGNTPPIFFPPGLAVSQAGVYMSQEIEIIEQNNNTCPVTERGTRRSKYVKPPPPLLPGLPLVFLPKRLGS